VHNADGKYSKDDRKLVWVPVKRTEPKHVTSSDQLDVVTLEKHESADCIVKSTETQPCDSSNISSNVLPSGTLVNRNINGSNSYHGLKPRELKIGGGGKDMQQQQWSGLVQQEETLEVSLQKDRDNSCYAEDDFICGGSNRRCTKRMAEKDNRKSETGGLSDQRRVFSAGDGIFARNTTVYQYRPRNSYVHEVGCGLVQGKPASTKGKQANNILGAFSNTSSTKRFESASLHAVSASLRRRVVKSYTSKSTQCSDSANRNGQKIIASNVFDQHRVFSAKQRILQYMPKNLGGSMTKAVAPETKPGSQWCPMGLTRTQKRHVQRLRALEIGEELAEKWRDKWFSENTPMIPTKRISQNGTSSHI
jgi:hypothetical protein